MTIMNWPITALLLPPRSLCSLAGAAIARKGKKVSERDYGDCRREVSEALPRLWRVLIKR